jgi:non-ribosomal peptide synthetase component F/SAM-dependent methyltransferase
MRSATMTPEQLALLDRLIADRGVAAGPTGAVAARGRDRMPVRPGDRRDMPASFAQQRIWFFDRLQPEATIYNVAGAARLKGRLDADLLARCLTELVERHEVLRTTYRAVDGRPVQTANPARPVVMPLIDLTDLPVDRREEAAQARCAEEVGKPFDLAADLMVRPVLLRMADDDHLLLLSQHHIATDGWSLNVLMREIGQLYVAHHRGVPAGLPELPVQYADFATWQRNWLEGDVLERQLDHWRSALAQNQLVDVATGLPRPTSLGWDGGTLEYRFDAELVQRATAVAESERATLYMLLVAAQSIVLSRWSGQDAAIVGCPVANRNRAEVESLIGCFVNELPLRVDLSGRPTFREVLRRAREACLGAYENQDVPFEKIVEAVNPERDAISHAPLVRHQLGLHNEPRWRVELPELTFEIAGLSTGTARFDLEVDLSPDDTGGLTGTVYYSTDLFTEEIVLRLLDGLRTVLTAAVADPDTDAALLPLLGERETERLRTECGAAPQRPAASMERTWPVLLAEQARRDPGAIALRSGDREVDRAGLERWAGAIADRLRAAGATDGQPVAICLPPSPAYVAALLAVARTGALAVSLDPVEPVADLDEILLDCAAALVIVGPGSPEGLDALVERVPVGAPAGGASGQAGIDPDPDAAAFVSYRVQGGEARGIVVSHAGVADRMAWALDAFPLGNGATVLVSGSVCAPWDLIGPLTAGATVELSTAVARRGRGPALLRCGTEDLATVLAGLGPQARALSHVVVDGEEPWPALVDAVFEAAPAACLYHLAGPADAALDMVARPFGARHRPGTLALAVSTVAGAHVRVLDAHGGAVPIGVAGDLWLGSAVPPVGVLSRPRESAGLFVIDPLGVCDRLYRADRRARWLPDGTLDLLAGEVRRHRHLVEVGEIAAGLRGLPEVTRAVVTALDTGAEDPELVAYVGLAATADPGTGREQFEQIYTGRSAEGDPVLNPGGWSSPQTGEILPASEMRAWSDATLRRILALNPTDVLEIGCKTGGLLFRLVPRVSQYIGTDVSARALAHVREHQDWMADKVDDVRLLERAADDLADVPDASVDTVVLNSVTQYFPHVAYLRVVLAEAVRVLRPGGHVYLAAVRDLTLLPALHLGAALERAAPGAVQRAVEEGVAGEGELAVDPATFVALARELPGVVEVHTVPRVGRHRNELTGYRYDVVLRTADPTWAVPPAPADRDWVEDALTTSALGDLLRTGSVPRLRVTGVPDGRHAGRLRALAVLAERPTASPDDLRAALAPVPPGPGLPVDPTELAAVAAEHGYAAVPVHAAGGGLDITFVRGAAPDAVPPGTGSGPACTEPSAARPSNDPLAAIRSRAALPRLHAHLQEHLPAYAVPRHVVAVERFPTDRRGRIDLAALPMPDLDAAAAEARRGPRTGTEVTIAEIWSDALGVDRMSVHDDFFSLGGHSLLGAEVIENVRTRYEVDVPLGRLFEAPTVAAVAAYVDEQLAMPRQRVAPIRRLGRDDHRRRRAERVAAR